MLRADEVDCLTTFNSPEIDRKGSSAIIYSLKGTFADRRSILGRYVNNYGDKYVENRTDISDF